MVATRLTALLVIPDTARSALEGQFIDEVVILEHCLVVIFYLQLCHFVVMDVHSTPLGILLPFLFLFFLLFLLVLEVFVVLVGSFDIGKHHDRIAFPRYFAEFVDIADLYFFLQGLSFLVLSFLGLLVLFGLFGFPTVHNFSGLILNLVSLLAPYSEVIKEWLELDNLLIISLLGWLRTLTHGPSESHTDPHVHLGPVA